MPKNLKIAQGGFIFDIRVKNRHAWITRALKRRWRTFTTNAAPVDINIIIACYDDEKVFYRPADRLEPFTRMFRKTLDRYPFLNGDPGLADQAESILSRLDPETRAIKQVAHRLQRHNGVLFASTATGLFFFLPADSKLFIFTRTTPAPFLPVNLIYTKPSQESACLLADITNGMMLALSWLLARNGGLLLHGTGVSRSGCAVLFLGLSDAGKSTVARNCTADACFSDDGVIVTRTQDGFMLHASLFTQAMGYWRRPLPHPLELRKLFLLNKCDQDRVSPLDKHYLMNHILLHLIHFFRYLDKKTAKKAFENTQALVAALPTYRFDFTKNRNDWSDIWQAPEKRKDTNLRS